MIHHISIAVENPLRAAGAFAEILNGQVYEFFPHPGSYIVCPFDEYGTAIEVYPIGTEIVPGSDKEPSAFVQGIGVPAFTPVHAAISVPTSLEKIEQVGIREGWRVVLCDRGPFHVIEFWVENWLMLEFLPVELTAEYLEFTHRHVAETFLGEPIIFNTPVPKQVDLVGIR